MLVKYVLIESDYYHVSGVGKTDDERAMPLLFPHMLTTAMSACRCKGLVPAQYAHSLPKEPIFYIPMAAPLRQCSVMAFVILGSPFPISKY